MKTNWLINKTITVNKAYLNCLLFSAIFQFCIKLFCIKLFTACKVLFYIKKMLNTIISFNQKNIARILQTSVNVAN